jgi:hypothetical protein
MRNIKVFILFVRNTIFLWSVVCFSGERNHPALLFAFKWENSNPLDDGYNHLGNHGFYDKYQKFSTSPGIIVRKVWNNDVKLNIQLKHSPAGMM